MEQISTDSKQDCKSQLTTQTVSYSLDLIYMYIFIHIDIHLYFILHVWILPHNTPSFLDFNHP